MRKRFAGTHKRVQTVFGLATLLLPITAGRQGLAQATNPPPRYVLTDSEAVVIGQPQMVAEIPAKRNTQP